MKAIQSENNEPNRRVVRRKVNPHSPPTTLEIHGIRVHFPFRPYECQETYMKTVIEALLRSENALLESPTGTGKTLCLLCACLAWQREHARQISQQNQVAVKGTIVERSCASAGEAKGQTNNLIPISRVPTIIYASRTHSQLSQVVRELRSTRYRPMHSVLGSREQMCVNPKVKKPHSTASEINHDCSKLCKDRKCRFRNHLEGFVAPANEEGLVSTDQPVMDLEDLIQMGRTHNICPFYYSRSQVDIAELILLPYNYLFDKDARATTLSTVPWENAIVIFDEAHNLESFASESASFDLTSTDIAGCMRELDTVLSYLPVESMPDLSYGLKRENVGFMKRTFHRLEEYILGLNPHQTAYSGEFMIEIFSKGAGITYAKHQIFIDEVKKVHDMLLDMRGSKSPRSGAPRLEHFVTCLKRVFAHSMESKCYAKAAFYRVYISQKQQQSSNSAAYKRQTLHQSEIRTISYWCFAPSLAMEELAVLKIRSILVTSGTLSPLPSYSLELGLPFPHILENPHIISNDQILLRIVGKGVSGKDLCSSFEKRKDASYYIELGSTLVSLIKVTPAGMLVFFPSYSVMETCIERWGGPSTGRNGHATTESVSSAFFAARRKPSTNPMKYAFPKAPSFFRDTSKPCSQWSRLLACKAVVLEPKSSADLPDAISEFKRFLNLPNSSGCVLMGVCRGKISEGIDFAHEQSRAVVITGLPFPPSHDPKVKMKRDYLDGLRAANSGSIRSDGGFGKSSSTDYPLGSTLASQQLSGHDWYTQQAHRAVNQAIGRVIRNVSDYGAVLLLDSRFEQPQNQKGLSAWLRPHIKKDEGVGKTIGALVAFYKQAELRGMEIAAKLQTEPVTLEYEDEETDSVSEKLTKITVIRAPADTAGSNKDVNHEDVGYVAPDRVIATIDVNDLQKRPSSPGPNLSNTSSKKSKTTTLIDDNKHQETSIPVQFFARAKVTLSKEDLSLIRTYVVSMRESGQKNDSKEFLKAAGDVVKMAVRCDSLERMSDARSPNNLVLLFMQLVPHSYRTDVEIMSMKRTFDSSSLNQDCKRVLVPEVFRIMRANTVALLRLVWCSAPEPAISLFEYLEQADEVLRIVVKLDKTGRTNIQKSFLELIPAKYKAPTRSLLNELLTARKIDRMKADEEIMRNQATQKDEKGKVSLPRKKNPLDSASSLKLRTAEQSKVTNPNCSNVIISKVNPYANKKKSDSMKNFRDAKASSVSMVDPKSISPVSKSSSGLNIPRAHQMNSNAAASMKKQSALSLLLRSAESETFVKESSAAIASSISMNATESMPCPLCSMVAIEPLMATCGHIACLRCWKTWLAKSASCPICRSLTTLESITRVIYERNPGDGAPLTLSQFCRPTGVIQPAISGRYGENENEEDSDGELELY